MWDDHNVRTFKQSTNLPLLQVRDLDNRFYDNCSLAAVTALEKYSEETSDIDALPEDARTLLLDKDTFMSAIQVLTAAVSLCSAASHMHASA